MPDDPRLSVSFVPLAGTAESRWLRLVQVEDEDDVATMADAAELIDRIFGLSPCSAGIDDGGGGDSGGEIEPPEEDVFLAAAAGSLGKICAAPDHWDAQVDLLRSHPEPGAYRVQAGDAEVIDKELVTGPVSETFSLDGDNHVDLGRPYHSGLRVTGATVRDVRGSTVNFTRPVRGRVRLDYTTRFVRLTVRVPAHPDEDNGQAEADPAAIIVFWDELAAQLILEQPEADDSIDAADRERLCRKVRPESTDCWERIRHHSKCRCSDNEAGMAYEWEETVPAPCPEGATSGARAGTRRVLDGHVACAGEEDENLPDPEYYEQVCCEPPPPMPPLPRCRTTYAVYRGGAPIEYGEQWWRDHYGEGVTLTAVMPEDGICGEEITSWDVNDKNCCDGIIPLSPHQDNPTEIWPGRSYHIRVHDGRPGDLRWEMRGGIRMEGGGTIYIGPSREIGITADEDICPQPSIRVDDGCIPLEMVFQAPEGKPLKLTTNDLIAYRGTRFTISVRGGVPPYTWMAGGGIELLGMSLDGRTGYFRTPADDNWCQGEVTATDVCGQSDNAVIRNSRGRWVGAPMPDGNNPPCAPYTLESYSTGVTKPKCGYRIHATTYYGESLRHEDKKDCKGPGELYGGLNVVDEEVFISGGSLGGTRWADECAARGANWRYSKGCCRNSKDGRVIYYTNKALSLFRWEC